MPPDFIVFVIVVLLVYQFGSRYVLTYRLTDGDVRAVLFGVVPVSVRRYEFIREVHTISSLESLLFMGWRVQSRFIARGVVIFSRDSLFFGAVLYTPEDPGGFARELRRRVYQQTGQLPLGR